LRGTRCWPRVAPRVVGRYVLNAPEGCPQGTHTSGTAYTRGTYSRVHTQTRNTHKHKQTHSPRYTTDGLRRSRPWQPQHRRKSHHRTSTRPTAGGRSPPSRSTRSCRIARGVRRSSSSSSSSSPRARSSVVRVGQPLDVPPTCRSRRTEPWTLDQMPSAPHCGARLRSRSVCSYRLGR
jgi:hypothetical protein